MRSVITVIVVFILWLGLPFYGQTAERKTELKVIYDASRLSVEAREISLRLVLEEIGAKVGFSVMEYGGSDKPLTVSIEKASLEEALDQILRGVNYAFVYGGERRGIEKVILLSSSTYMQATTENQQQKDKRQEGIVQVQSGLTHHSSAYQPSPFGVQKRANQAEAEIKVEAIMRVHALSGLIGPAGIPSETTNAPQTFGSPARSSLSTRPMFTQPPPQDIHETLATTTHLAQQNLKALVDGLATASNSLFQSLSNSRR
jgi:hypothetical protein